jgi:hypothetical protein
MIRDCWPENSGPLLVGIDKNLSAKELKAMLNGKIGFIQCADNKIGQHLWLYWK